MAYSIRFLSRARLELDHSTRIYGSDFAGRTFGWLEAIADAAERRDESTSVRIDELAGELTKDSDTWKFSWKQWWRADLAHKARGLLHALKKHQPPWEPMVTTMTFMVQNTFACQVHAYYVVDHTNKEVLFMMFDGLPGPLPKTR